MSPFLKNPSFYPNSSLSRKKYFIPTLIVKLEEVNCFFIKARGVRTMRKLQKVGSKTSSRKNMFYLIWRLCLQYLVQDCDYPYYIYCCYNFLGQCKTIYMKRNFNETKTLQIVYIWSVFHEFILLPRVCYMRIH